MTLQQYLSTTSCLPLPRGKLQTSFLSIPWWKCSEVSYSISSQGLGSFSRFLDLKLRKHIVDLDLIDTDRIYKWKVVSSSVFLSFLFLSLSPAELSAPCQRILRCGRTVWVSISLPWLGDHHALQLHSGICCEPLRSSHGLCRKCSEVSYSISSQGLGSFSRLISGFEMARWLRSKWQRIELTINHICHFFHFRTLAAPLSSTFEMMTSHRPWETGHYSDKTLFNSWEQGNNGL